MPLLIGRPRAPRPPHPPRLPPSWSFRNTYKTVRRTLGALAAQTATSRVQIVFVTPSPALVALDEKELDVFHSWRMVESPIPSIAHAYAAGIRAAAAPLVALTEDHSFPAPNWAERLIAAHRGDYAVVGPAIRNGNPDTAVSWADFVIAYGKWAEPVQSAIMDFLPGHNSCYKRALLLNYGERLGEVLEAETVLHLGLHARGCTLWLESSTYTTHLNFALWRPWLSAQFHGSRRFGAERSADWSIGKRLAFALGAPLIPFVRFLRIQHDARRMSLTLWSRTCSIGCRRAWIDCRCCRAVSRLHVWCKPPC